MKIVICNPEISESGLSRLAEKCLAADSYLFKLGESRKDPDEVIRYSCLLESFFEILTGATVETAPALNESFGKMYHYAVERVKQGADIEHEADHLATQIIFTLQANRNFLTAYKS